MSLEKAIQKLVKAIQSPSNPNMAPDEPGRKIDPPGVKYTCKTTTPEIGAGSYCQCKTKNGCLVFSAQGVCTVEGFSGSVPMDRPCLNGGTAFTHGQQ